MTLLGIVTVAALFVAGTQPAPASEPNQEGFARWLAEFREQALAEGFEADLLDRAFAGIRYNPAVVRAVLRQPEFIRPVRSYLDSAVSDRRIAAGTRMRDRYRSALAQIAERHGVDPEILLAIWGLESGYGSNFGSYNVIEALATLIYQGSRRGFGERELFAALRILETENLDPAELRGSWAGAMGHTQFMPTSYLAYAVDENGDGIRNLWSDDPVDALASTANYLALHDWRTGSRWGLEVFLPVGFDFRLVDQDLRKPVEVWHSLGVTEAGGGSLQGIGEGEPGALFAPAGAGGPTFLLFDNFRVLMRYNHSTSYALAVSLLADRIRGEDGIQGAWPEDDSRVRTGAIRQMQEQLTTLGYDTRGIDGIVGPDTRAAIRAFQEQSGEVPDGHVSAELIRAIREAASEIDGSS